MQNKDKEGIIEGNNNSAIVLNENEAKNLRQLESHAWLTDEVIENAKKRKDGFLGDRHGISYFLSLPLVSSSMPKNKEGWEKRFDESFAHRSWLSTEASYRKNLKAFIKKEKEIDSQDLIEKIEGMKIGLSRKIDPWSIQVADIENPNSWNLALSTIQEIIKQDEN